EDSRECALCNAVPRNRDFLVPCGHILCCVCAKTIAFDAIIHGNSFSCPYCQAYAFRAIDRITLEEDVEPTSKRSQKETTRSREQIERVARLLSMKGQFSNNQRRYCPDKIFTRPDKSMVRVNQPMKQQLRF
ncbi:hypothetical protein PRIPAC_75428, partial [Pristionchus pacificus]|uniref:Zinc finger protein n=1 Tax=Pristionchus pacificus TaxID=54126 RepID=A0A2A6BZY2_PRIPA